MISREEFLNDLEAAFQEVKDIKSGKLQPITLEEL